MLPKSNILPNSGEYAAFTALSVNEFRAFAAAVAAELLVHEFTSRERVGGGWILGDSSAIAAGGNVSAKIRAATNEGGRSASGLAFGAGAGAGYASAHGKTELVTEDETDEDDDELDQELVE